MSWHDIATFAISFLTGFIITSVIQIWKSAREYKQIERERASAALRSPTELGLYDR